MKVKGKVYATILSDSNSSNLDLDVSCDEEGNFSTFMTIAHMESSDDLRVLVEELGEHTKLESIGIVEESDDEEDEGTVGLQETYNSLLEKTGEYAKVANVAIKKMKRARENYRSLLVRYKEAKCEIETLNGELTKANAKVERVFSKKLDEVLSHQNSFSNRTGLGYTRESSSTVNISKEVKFMKAKEPTVVATTAEKVKEEKNKNVANQRMLLKPHNQSVVKSDAKGKSLSKSQRGPRTRHFFHHYGLQGHTKPNFHKFRALKNA